MWSHLLHFFLPTFYGPWLLSQYALSREQDNYCEQLTNPSQAQHNVDLHSAWVYVYGN